MRSQLKRGCDQLQEFNPVLYRDLALYLQVLREVLPLAVEQACFHLATHFHPQRYCELPAQQRRNLRERTAALVQQAASLLTVEQLGQLAGRLAALKQERQRDLLDELRPQSPEARSPNPEPAGSVELAMELPVELSWSGIPSLGAADADPDGDDEPPANLPEDPQELPGSPTACRSDQTRQPPPPWDSPLLPGQPQALVTWLEGSEQALVRRLRNLSQAVNVELLRSGLGRTLLPVTLLEAALRGQVEPLSAPPNLLRVQLPLTHPSGSQLESLAVLVRPADLELEHPRLRSCRARLQRHRQEIRRMADQHRRLQRRLQALEAERLWHQDSPRFPQP
ncbi:MAG: hypothetical protein AAFX65_00980 [Cyanobacteria bacterium J06638_7]